MTSVAEQIVLVERFLVFGTQNGVNIKTLNVYGCLWSFPNDADQRTPTSVLENNQRAT